MHNSILSSSVFVYALRPMYETSSLQVKVTLSIRTLQSASKWNSSSIEVEFHVLLIQCSDMFQIKRYTYSLTLEGLMDIHTPIHATIIFISLMVPETQSPESDN